MERVQSPSQMDNGSGRYSDVEKFALVLKDVIEQSPGKALTKDVIEEELEKKGLFRLPLTGFWS